MDPENKAIEPERFVGTQGLNAHATVFAVATMDTKQDELLFVVDRLRQLRISVCVVDISTSGSICHAADVGPQQILDLMSIEVAELPKLDRGTAVNRMTESFALFMRKRCEHQSVLGVIGIGGSGGTAIITAAMRQLPVGVPKMMVSTVASGNTAAYVDCTDICMMYSVVDVAGLNRVSRRILGNAAAAMAGMLQAEFSDVSPTTTKQKPTLGMTMFGVTTLCVNRVRQSLESHGFECLVFHATGSGGRAMEKLVDSGLIQGVLDITTTEVADQIAGGVFPCGAARFDVLLEKRIPLVMSLGAVDMVNFGAVESVPATYAKRLLHVHNSQVTLMRTTVDENASIAKWIAGKLRHAQSAVKILFPEAGVSALDAAGQPFHDAGANTMLIETLQSELQTQPLVSIRRLPLHINDEAFSDALVDEFLAAWKHCQQ